LKDEAKAQVDYYQKMINLSRILPQKISTVNNDTDVVGPDKFLLTAHTGEFKEAMHCCHIGHLCSHSVVSECSFCKFLRRIRLFGTPSYMHCCKLLSTRN
jgi:hypothetical protein